MEMEVLVKTEQQEHEEALKSRFELLLKNRDALCDGQGNLLKENQKYEKAYLKLLNQVGELTSTVATDMTTKIYFMPQDKAKGCIEVINKLYLKMQPEFKKVIRRGTYEDLSSVMNSFCQQALTAYLCYMMPDSEYAKSERKRG